VRRRRHAPCSQQTHAHALSLTRDHAATPTRRCGRSTPAPGLSQARRSTARSSRTTAFATSESRGALLSVLPVPSLVCVIMNSNTLPYFLVQISGCSRRVYADRTLHSLRSAAGVMLSRSRPSCPLLQSKPLSRFTLPYRYALRFLRSLLNLCSLVTSRPHLTFSTLSTTRPGMPPGRTSGMCRPTALRSDSECDRLPSGQIQNATDCPQARRSVIHV
jgi:hypothetical protein